MLQKTIARLLPNEVVFLECDIQKTIFKHIMNSDTVSHNAKRMAQVAKLFDIPIIATKQANFGDIVPEITDHHFDKVKIFEKNEFTMLEDPVFKYLNSLHRKKVVLYGIEAHICVKQTCLDLLERDYQVHLLVDGISSMNAHDRTVGIEAMRDAGAIITTFQSLVFELTRIHTHPKFKDLLKIVKDMPKEHLHLHHHKL